MRRKKGRPILGIDIGYENISVVEMRGAWPNPQLLCAESAPTPPGAVESGQIADIDAIVESLRKLLDKLPTKTREAVMGVAARNVMTRVLEVPSVPTGEMAAVVEGEVQHQKMLRDASGSFDFVHLSTTDSSSAPQVLVMAAEEISVSHYRIIADRLGLRLLALEPVLSAMYRAASPQVYARPSSLCVTVGHGEAEISVVEDGKIRLYRRVDNGSEMLLARGGTRKLDTYAAPGVQRGLSMLGTPDEDEDDLDADQPAELGLVDVNAAAALGLEIQRSIDYYSREYPDAAPISHVVVSMDVPALLPFASWLGASLRIDTTAATLNAASVEDHSVLAMLQPPQGLRFTTAAGLAMRELAGVPPSVPRFDLLGQREADRLEALALKRLAVGLSAAAAVLCWGLFTGITTSIRATQTQAELARGQIELKRLEALKAIRIDRLEKQKQVMARLRLDGLPLPKISDAVAATVPQRVGLTELAINKAGAVSIGGEASNDKVLITLLEGLKMSPYLQNTSLDSFDSSTQNTGKPPVVRFQVSAQLVGIRRPKLPAPADPNSASKS